jgi:hypothetical protein
MRAINHALTGAVIGAAISEPAIALPLAFFSHYVCDAIPHYGGGKPEEEELNSPVFRSLLLVDAGLCGLLVLILALYRPKHWLLMAVCAFLAASPDLFSIGRYKSAREHHKPNLNAYQRFASGIQWFERPIGAVVEVAWFIAMLIILVIIIRHR